MQGMHGLQDAAASGATRRSSRSAALRATAAMAGVAGAGSDDDAQTPRKPHSAVRCIRMQQHGKTAGQACTMSTVFCLYLSFVSPHDACHAATISRIPRDQASMHGVVASVTPETPASSSR